MNKYIVLITFTRWSDDNSILGTHQAVDVVMADNLLLAVDKWNKRNTPVFLRVAEFKAIEFKEVEI